MDRTHASSHSVSFVFVSLIAVGVTWLTLRLRSVSGGFSILVASTVLGVGYIGFLVDSHRRSRGMTWTQTIGFWLMRLVVLLRYRVVVHGQENLPQDQRVLIIANHVSYADAVIMGVSLPRHLRFLGNAKLCQRPILGRLFKIAGVVPVSPEKARSAIRTSVACLEQEEAMVIFPEGHLTRDGDVAPFQDGFRLIARRANAPVVPVYLDGLWGSIFSFKGGRFFWKWPQFTRRTVHIRIGQPIPTDMSAADARQLVLDHGVDAFQQRSELKGHLGAHTVESLLKQGSEVVVVDHSMAEPKEMKANVLASAALNLSKVIREQCPEKRVGIVLPPSLGGILTNLAVCLADKTPVNLNFTLGKAALERCFEKAELKTVITAAPVRTQVDGRMPGFPWPEHTLDVRDLIAGIGKFRIIKTLLSLKLFGAKSALNRFQVPTDGDNEEAALLFTSGSDGDPKGVVLTHRNILGNIGQVGDCGVLPEGETLLANLPIFHSFGFTVQVWTALNVGVKVVTTPSPLDFKKAADVIEKEHCSILLGTPTFFRPYLKRVEPEKLKSLKIVVAGAEKTPEGFHDAWEKRFPGSHYLEGYGLTETTPVAAVNVPDLPAKGDSPAVTRTRRGSVGRLFTGMAARIECPDTGAILPVTQTGILCLRGVNIFDGYLGEPEKTSAVIDEDGWFRTGDLGRCDDDGFVIIEGRLSRFSKIGGEMVPHGTVETALAKAFDVAESELPQLAITARSDDAKGEALVMFTTFEIDADTLRDKAKDAGLANLWIPKDFRKVDAIPTLASGKLDLKGLKKLAAE